MAIAAPCLMCRISPREMALINCVESLAAAANRPARALLLQALLQLPRWADARGLLPFSMVEPLLRELVGELPITARWLIPGVETSPRCFDFDKIDAEDAKRVMQTFHYLRSPRTDGRAYGLTTNAGHLVALCVSSPLDVESLNELLALHGYPDQFARVISRVFAFEGAPKNSISYLLSRAAREESRLGVTDLLTYVNPNMGFTGSSYRASGWHLLGTEPGTTYSYLDDRYITDRELAARFGQHDRSTYLQLLGNRFAFSVMKLQPLLVFHARLGRRNNSGDNNR